MNEPSGNVAFKSFPVSDVMVSVAMPIWDPLPSSKSDMLSPRYGIKRLFFNGVVKNINPFSQHAQNLYRLQLVLESSELNNVARKYYVNLEKMCMREINYFIFFRRLVRKSQNNILSRGEILQFTPTHSLSSEGYYISLLPFNRCTNAVQISWRFSPQLLKFL